MNHGLLIDATVLRRLLWGILGLCVVSSALTVPIHPSVPQGLLLHLIGGMPACVGLALLTRGRELEAAWSLIGGLVVVLWGIAITHGGVASPVSFLAVIPVALAFFLLGAKTGVRIALLTSAIGTAVVALAPWLPEAAPTVLGGSYLTLLVSISVPTLVMYATITELGEQRQIAQQEARAARDASLAKSRFLANMSHEFRTPLSAIIGYSEFIHEGADMMDADELRENLENVVTSAHHLLHLVNDVLDLSKVEAGKMELDIRAFDAKEPIAAVLTSTRTLIAARRNELVVEVGALGVLHTDSVKLSQCVLNLVSNAAKFTENGTITVRAWRDIERALFVEVSDTGVGIEADQMERLFQEFSQAHPTTARHFGGTGLGLSLTRAFCQLMQGEVDVKSVVGQGSTFRLRIPDLRHAMSASSLDEMSRGEALSGK